MASSPSSSSPDNDAATFVISGAGIVGLTFALALKKHLPGIDVEIYDKVDSFQDDIGAGMGMYPNGNRVLRDCGSRVLDAVRANGKPFLYRRWAKHDGVEIAQAEETVLHDGDEQVQSLGIGRWRLHKILYDAVLKAGIKIHFGKSTMNVTQLDNSGLVELCFEDGTSRLTKALFATDGTRSMTRQILTGESSQLKYIGVTCLMGIADCKKPDTGVCSPSSTTTKCHATFFPTLEEEQCFQFYFPIAEQDADTGNWGTLSEKVGKEECLKLAEKLRQDGWDEKYLAPLEQVTRAVRIGFCELDPPLKRWAYDRIVLLGDAAHPPVPYTGQGAQMGLEDAATLAILLKEFCLNEDGTFNVDNFGKATLQFETMRIPRVAEIQKKSNDLGAMQQKQAECQRYARKQAMTLQREVFFHETLSLMIPGAQYDFEEEIQKALKT